MKIRDWRSVWGGAILAIRLRIHEIDTYNAIVEECFNCCSKRSPRCEEFLTEFRAQAGLKRSLTGL